MICVIIFLCTRVLHSIGPHYFTSSLAEDLTPRILLEYQNGSICVINCLASCRRHDVDDLFLDFGGIFCSPWMRFQ